MSEKFNAGRRGGGKLPHSSSLANLDVSSLKRSRNAKESQHFLCPAPAPWLCMVERRQNGANTSPLCTKNGGKKAKPHENQDGPFQHHLCFVESCSVGWLAPHHALSSLSTACQTFPKLVLVSNLLKLIFPLTLQTGALNHSSITSNAPLKFFPSLSKHVIVFAHGNLLLGVHGWLIEQILRCVLEIPRLLHRL